MFTPVLMTVAAISGLLATAPTPEEMLRAEEWAVRHFEQGAPFFSFVCGGTPSSELLNQWQVERVRKDLDSNRTRHTIVHRSDFGLELRCEAIVYRDYPSVEWTLYLKNNGSADSPMLESVQAIDATFQHAGEAEYQLHHNKGDNCTADSYEPMVTPLPPKADERIANTGGRPTQIAFPYFNIAAGDEGMIFVLSWAGQWSAQFLRDAERGLTLRAGQELTHFVLHPGEEVRTPMVVLQFYGGGRQRAQNVWRAWMLAHNTPRVNGALPLCPQLAACSSHQFGEMINANSESQKFFIDGYLGRGMKLDYWWMDAGWYWNQNGWPNTGTWEVDTNRFPGGLRPIADHAHGKDVDIILWFEPERVTKGTWLSDNHPEWIFGGKEGGLLKLGEPEVRQWLTDHVDKLITEQGIDLYRQDFNMDPLPHWRKNDAPDRQGISEIRHVQGYLAYWDELQRRHPGMLIDSCASGGRRNDLETLRRALPLLRSDYIMEPVGNQCHTYALASWFPYYGTGTSKTDEYWIRSTLCPHFTACWDQRDASLDWPALAALIQEWKAFAPNYYGDYYPLTKYSLGDADWMAWQFDRPEAGEGMVQVFRRDNSPYETARLPLHALDPAAEYVVEIFGHADSAIRCLGAELLEQGLPVKIADRPGTAFFVYRKASGR